MRALMLIICVLLAVLLVIYPFTTTGGAGNYTWFLLVLPVFLFVGRVLADPAARARPMRQVIVQVPAAEDSEAPDAEAPGRRIWNGSVRLYPPDCAEPMRVFPLRLQLSMSPPRVQLLRPLRREADGIIGIEVLASDPHRQEMDWRLNLRINGRVTRHTAAIALMDGRWVSADESDPVLIDLSPLRVPRVALPA